MSNVNESHDPTYTGIPIIENVVTVGIAESVKSYNEQLAWARRCAPILWDHFIEVCKREDKIGNYVNFLGSVEKYGKLFKIAADEWFSDIHLAAVAAAQLSERSGG